MPDSRRLGSCLLVLAILAAAAWFGRDYVRTHPEAFPWTDLDLRDPVGRFTRAKLAALADDRARCTATLRAVDPDSRTVDPSRPADPACIFDDAILLRPTDRTSIRYAPALKTACPVAAALTLWVRDTVQPAAVARFGIGVAKIENFGSYSCRRRYSRADAAWSEHATGDAVDIAAFLLADGRRVSVLQEWPGTGAEAAFLRDVRDGACALFTTVLSPDYNAAHRDHLHFDMASGGKSGWHLCR